MKRLSAVLAWIILPTILIGFLSSCQSTGERQAVKGQPQYANREALASTDWVQTHLADGDIRISIVRSDKKGETSFSTEKIQLHYWSSTAERTADQPVEKFGFYHFDKTLDVGLHTAPRMQFILILRGTLQVETTDGERRQFPPGSALLVTDTQERRSFGHKTKVVGGEDVFAAVVSVPPGSDLATLFRDR